MQGSVNLTADPASAPVRQTRVFDPQFQLGAWNGEIPPNTARLFGAQVTALVRDWLLARLVRTDGAQAIWISFAQLYIDYQQATGHAGPLKVAHRWVDPSQRAYLAPESFTFKARLKWFRQLLKMFFQESPMTVGLAQCRPQSQHIQAFVQSASLPWNLASLAAVDRWLGEQLCGPCVRSAAILHTLPLAPKCAHLAVG